MKKITFNFILIAALTGLGACKKDFLQVVPQGSIVASSTKDYDLMLNSPDFYFTATGGNAMQVLMGDEVAAEGSQFNGSTVALSQNCFKWVDDIFKTAGDTPFDLYNYLQLLYACNKIINEIPAATGEEGDKAQLKAEAMANRAFIYFQLINAYAKPYNQASAATDPGFPIILQANVNQSFGSRNTVAEVYQLIINDLLAAIKTLPLQHPGGVTRFGKAGAEALLGKVYLFMGKSDTALPLLTAAIIDNAVASSPARLYDYNKEFSAGGKFYPITPMGPTNAPGMTYRDNTESVLARSFSNGPVAGGNIGNNFIVLTEQTKALYMPSDLRLNLYKAQFPYFQPNPSGRLSKYAVQYTRYGIQLSELYLLLAEAKARTNDLAGAKAAVEMLRKNRMPVADAQVPVALAGDRQLLLNFILEERIREFAGEGYRWFDMRRLSTEPAWNNVTYTHTLYNDVGFANITTFTLRPERFALRLPPYIMNANPQFSNNP